MFVKVAHVLATAFGGVEVCAQLFGVASLANAVIPGRAVFQRVHRQASFGVPLGFIRDDGRKRVEEDHPIDMLCVAVRHVDDDRASDVASDQAELFVTENVVD